VNEESNAGPKEEPVPESGFGGSSADESGFVYALDQGKPRFTFNPTLYYKAFIICALALMH
jgi:hypothetical protein